MISPTPSAPGHVHRIVQIDGLRGWLAWMVVFFHVAQLAGLDRRPFGAAQMLAADAVYVFMIVSGFVIAEVLIAEREGWLHFITRRAWRLFPLYFLLLPIGFVTTYLAQAAFAHMAWASDPLYRYGDTIDRTIASVEAAPVAHTLAHILLLQGLLPDSVLDQASTSFLGPAWSLSLEWQFYLVAPILIGALRSRRWSFAAGIVLIAVALLYHFGASHIFRLPSALPASLHFFLIGIGSRLALPEIARLRIAATAVLGALLCAALMLRVGLPIFIWIALLAVVVASGGAQFRGDRIVLEAARRALASRFARWQGARSYAVYLVHWPILQTLAFVLAPYAGGAQGAMFTLLIVLTPAASLLAAHALHIAVERPLIRFGARFADRIAPPPAPLSAGLASP